MPAHLNSVSFSHTVNLEIFARVLFSRIALKDILTMLKLKTRTWFTYISKLEGDFATSGGLYFHETSHKRSFPKIKTSQKFSNLQ